MRAKPEDFDEALRRLRVDCVARGEREERTGEVFFAAGLLFEPLERLFAPDFDLLETVFATPGLPNAEKLF
jgi:hypothetical protein